MIQISQNTLIRYMASLTKQMLSGRPMECLIHSFKKKTNLKHCPTAAPKWFYCSFAGGRCKDGLCFSFVKLAEDDQPRSRGKQTGKGVGVCGEGRESEKLKTSQNEAATINELIRSV